MKKTKLSQNSYQLNLQLDLEAHLLKAYEKLQEYAERSLGLNVVQMYELIQAPNSAQYLVDLYDELYIKDTIPKHIDRSKIFEQYTGVTVEGIQQAKNQLNGYIEKMGRYSPTINALGVKSNIKASDFNIYLDEGKRSYYETLNHLLDVVDELKQFGGVAEPIHLIRGFKNLRLDGLTPVIDINKFT